MSITVTEVIRRSEQGVTRPFICRSAVGTIYFVKGLGARLEELRAEWIGANLAEAVDLPIAPFTIVEVPEELVEASAVEGIGELQGRYAFGSQAIQGAQEVTFIQAQAVSLEMRAKILLFDWWIMNQDRNLNAVGGNPNLLALGGQEPELRIIDHHAAFDKQFNFHSFWQTHVFGSARAAWTPAWRDRARDILLTGTNAFQTAWDLLPPRWLPHGDCTSPDSELERDRLRTILNRPHVPNSNFWGTP
jgi:hypothetical protein